MYNCFCTNCYKNIKEHLFYMSGIFFPAKYKHFLHMHINFEKKYNEILVRVKKMSFV